MITARMWRHLAQMSEYYAALGYRDLPQPWTASKQAIDATLPPDRKPFVLSDGRILLGSAEQAFIDRMIADQMRPGTYQATTPCFRREPVFDELHQPYFMKLELIHYSPLNPEADLERMIVQARGALDTLLPVGCPDIQVEKTDIGLDLTLRGTEIGSYGVREYEGHQWVYGTGIAEPRFTTVAYLELVAGVE